MEYRKPMPEFLHVAAQTPTLQRLKGVGMHCGCQYTDFPVFRSLVPYSRFDHSLAVARILWDFTSDPVQALAGLLHDAATPVFSHVVDFLNGDHLTQESTEEGLEDIIKNDAALIAAMGGIVPESVTNCGRYPLADCSSPRLCADRLEYTLSNGIHYGFSKNVQSMYDALVVDVNEDGVDELVFTSAQTALEFADMALACGKVYICDEDRYAMERLSQLLKKALEENIITQQDLYTDESRVIQKLPKEAWESFCRLARVFRVDRSGEFSYRVAAKKRYIDPLVRNRGRVSALFPGFKERMEEFRSCSQDYYIYAE